MPKPAVFVLASPMLARLARSLGGFEGGQCAMGYPAIGTVGQGCDWEYWFYSVFFFF